MQKTKLLIQLLNAHADQSVHSISHKSLNKLLETSKNDLVGYRKKEESLFYNRKGFWCIYEVPIHSNGLSNMFHFGLDTKGLIFKLLAFLKNGQPFASM